MWPGAGIYSQEQLAALSEYGLEPEYENKPNPHPTGMCSCGLPKECVANSVCFTCDPTLKPSKGLIMANRNRTRCNNLSKEERERLGKLAMEMIYRGKNQ